MTNNYQRTKTIIPIMWVVAVLFFLITEGLVIVSERGQLKELSPVRLWSFPFMVSMPLIAGAGFASQISKNSQDDGSSVLAMKAAVGIATLELLVYAILSGLVSMYLK